MRLAYHSQVSASRKANSTRPFALCIQGNATTGLDEVARCLYVVLSMSLEADKQDPVLEQVLRDENIVPRARSVDTSRGRYVTGTFTTWFRSRTKVRVVGIVSGEEPCCQILMQISLTLL
jgi:hypothetical protein